MMKNQSKKQPFVLRTKGLLPRYHLTSLTGWSTHSNPNQFSGFALTGNPAPFYSPVRDFFGGFTGRPLVRVELGRLSARGAPSLSVTGSPTPPGNAVWSCVYYSGFAGGCQRCIGKDW